MALFTWKEKWIWCLRGQCNSILDPYSVLNINYRTYDTRPDGILLLTNRSFHLTLCSIPGQIVGRSVYFFFLRLPYCPDIVYFIGYVKMVYCGSVRIKLDVYTSGIFCFELPKWIKWNKKLLFTKKDQRKNSLPDYLSWSSSELLKTDSDQLVSVQIHYRFWSVQNHCNIGFPLSWKEGGNISEPIHTVSFSTLRIK